MARYTFFTNPMSRGQIARWALHEVAADYAQVLIAWDDKPAALTAANPLGKVPTLIDHAPGGDRVITECAAICAYLAEMHPVAGLLPDDAEKADYFRWLFFAAGPVEAAITTRFLGVEVPPEREVSAGWGNYERMAGALEGHFATHDFVCGKRFTMADVYVGSQIDWGLAFNTLPDRPALAAYAGRVRARPAYQAANAIDNALIAAQQQ